MTGYFVRLTVTKPIRKENGYETIEAYQDFEVPGVCELEAFLSLLSEYATGLVRFETQKIQIDVEEEQ